MMCQRQPLLTKCKPSLNGPVEKDKIFKSYLNPPLISLINITNHYRWRSPLFEYALNLRHTDYNSELMNVYMVLLNKDKFNNLCNTLDESKRKHDEKFYIP